MSAQDHAELDVTTVFSEGDIVLVESPYKGGFSGVAVVRNQQNSYTLEVCRFDGKGWGPKRDGWYIPTCSVASVIRTRPPNESLSRS